MDVRVNGFKTLTLIAIAVVVGLSSTAAATDQGLAAANQVSMDSYIDFMDNWLYTHAGDDRGFGSEHDLARDNIASLFESYGLTVTLEPFDYGGDIYYNVVGTKLGTFLPAPEYVVGAHFDSVNNPGADDNASGVALVLEAARIITQYDSAYTIRFIAFDREEQGLVGAYAYVDAHIGDNILGMVNADMIAHDTNTDHAKVYGGSANDLPIKTDLIEAVDMYGDGLTAADYGNSGGSDHLPFSQAGIQAAFLHESIFCPQYHSPDDNFEFPGNLNFPYATKMTRAVVGFLVDHAGVQVPVDALSFSYPEGQPEFVAPLGGTRMRVDVAEVGDAVHDPGSGLLHYNVGLSWQTVPMEVVTDGVYEAVFPAAPCGQELLYYVSADTTGGQNFTEPWNAPTAYYSPTAAYGETIYFSDNFETDHGWTAAGNAQSGQWERGVPVGGGDRGDPASDYDGSGQCYLTENVDGDSDIDGGYTYLTSPLIDLSSGDAIIRYALWYTNNNGGDPNNDLFKCYVSDNAGFDWTLVETVGPVSISGWIEHAFQVSDYVTPTSDVRVQFEASDLGDGSVVEAGIDGFMVFNFICEPENPADLNGDGVVDAGDLALLLGSWGACPGCPADLTGDQTVDAEDLALLLGSWG